MLSLLKGRYRARIAETPGDIRAAQRLRWLAFVAQRRDAPLPPDDGPEIDADAFDAICRHVLIEDARGTLVACFRLLPLAGGREIGRSYSAQYYELGALADYPGRMVEMGRFCLRPGVHDPDILRVAWGAMTRFVDAEKVEMLFGCSSFMGTEPETYLDAFAMLRERHLAPKRWLPRVKAPHVFRFARKLRDRKPDAKRAMIHMPPLLRSYLLMGGWVSDHAVVDRQLDTLHVFTGLEIAAIPPARARALREVAG
ncbi:GNAT family N-acetyltransferase [Phaeovulum vinaykumarii]|uniref:L-ornithine N(alpha)-acyltransferase n=1 Tax=Phaeovulum vinaykumarii TaxID=407234 RepID=A0A1N7JQ67_9RHOB|nr:GNAT family N-acetyltransferase [Phaeovulum vinaykumarii]SIS51394.1 ornithine-acyl[acyl carrier protein] N-acyltransferase [Phaeovulum vinaykumarii]SOB90726.1 ornithine-acyl[acyl carrier protein] N-acyltransferase [Phaeovulum vinaykumarii]